MGDTVLVTGGSGYIGSWCVARLLQQGYTVRATVRDLKKAGAARAAIATVAPEAADPGRLTFYAATLESDDGWGEAVSGCRYVLHVASPIPLQQPKDPEELVGPARDGALRVLKAAVEAACERVVMTSSVAAVGEHGTGVADESQWTDLDGKGVSPYARSKTIAEKAARDFMADHNAATSFATVNPSLVLGPVMSPDASPSVEVVSRLLSGDVPAIPRVGFCIVDVRDIADLHIQGHDRAGGRRRPLHRGWGSSCGCTEVAAILKADLGPRAAKTPTRRMPDWLVRLGRPVQPDGEGHPALPRRGAVLLRRQGRARPRLEDPPRPRKRHGHRREPLRLGRAASRILVSVTLQL